MSFKISIDRERIAQGGKNLNLLASRRDDPELYLFFSLDLVNSTLFKRKFPDVWADIVADFYMEVIGSFPKYQWLVGTTRWKYVGDEVLLYLKIEDLDTLIHMGDIIDSTHKIINSIDELIHRRYQESKQVLSIKGTNWAGFVMPYTQRNKKDGDIKNCNFIIETPEDSSIDFLGPEIDVGFRIAKYTHKKRLVVSADLAYILLSLESPVCKNLRVLSLEELKGVWNGRRYPIIWHESKWEDVKRTFDYDEFYSSDMVSKAIEIGSNKEGENIDQLTKIYSDLDIKINVETLKEWISKEQLNSSNSESFVTLNADVELHCVAMCFNPKGEILVGKRGKDKVIEPNKWEFGCGQLRGGQDIPTCLKQSYEEDFGVNIKLPKSLLPVGTFNLKAKPQKTAIGLIFIADVAKPEKAENKKHQEIKWINPKDLPFSPDECVPDFKEDVDKALKIRASYS
jgi:isopentenyldiphosphate isomerase